jgi:hypothetical protein
MIIRKITEGYVTQEWDTEKQKWTRQTFTAGTVCDYEREDGNTVDHREMTGPDKDEPYLPYDMVQPE